MCYPNNRLLLTLPVSLLGVNKQLLKTADAERKLSWKKKEKT